MRRSFEAHSRTLPCHHGGCVRRLCRAHLGILEKASGPGARSWRPARDEVIAPAHKTIRDRIVIRRAKRTQTQIGADLEAITVAANRLGIDYSGGYVPKTERFHVMVGAPAMVERVQPVIPDSVRADTDIKVGALPVPELALPRSPTR